MNSVKTTKSDCEKQNQYCFIIKNVIIFSGKTFFYKNRILKILKNIEFILIILWSGWSESINTTAPIDFIKFVCDFLFTSLLLSHWTSQQQQSASLWTDRCSLLGLMVIGSCWLRVWMTSPSSSSSSSSSRTRTRTSPIQLRPGCSGTLHPGRFSVTVWSTTARWDTQRDRQVERDWGYILRWTVPLRASIQSCIIIIIIILRVNKYLDKMLSYINYIL